MWKRFLSLLILLGLTLCMLSFAACNEEERRLMEHFPEWKDVTEELLNAPIYPSVKLDFQGINFETYSSPEGDLFDEVLVHLTNTGDTPVREENIYAVAYLYDEKWYSVYQKSDGDSKLVFDETDKHFIHDPEVDISFLVPSGLFNVPGQYKLYYTSYGFCDIDIVFVPEELNESN